jgi:hypothetical protein
MAFDEKFWSAEGLLKSLIFLKSAEVGLEFG